LVGDVFLPLVHRILEGLGIEYPCESLKSPLADSATPVSDCRICHIINRVVSWISGNSSSQAVLDKVLQVGMGADGKRFLE
jgi:hypothetical protein